MKLYLQLELNNNKLTGDDLNILVNQCPNLRKVKIENNNIDKIEKIKNLTGLNIKKLNIKGNPFIKDNKNYKNELYNNFLSLICIDDCDKEGNDVESTEYGGEPNYLIEDEESDEYKEFNNENKEDDSEIEEEIENSPEHIENLDSDENNEEESESNDIAENNDEGE